MAQRTKKSEHICRHWDSVYASCHRYTCGDKPAYIAYSKRCVGIWFPSRCIVARCIVIQYGISKMMRPANTVPHVFLCSQTVDFRKSIAGLSLLVEQTLMLDPFAPALYVFSNRKRDKVKILYWEKNGFCLWYKSLEKERFKCIGWFWFMAQQTP